MKTLAVFACVITAALTQLATAAAAPIKVTWTGTVDAVSGLSTVNLGDTISGSFVYNPDAVRLSTTPGDAGSFATYAMGTSTDLKFSLGSLSGTFGQGQARVFNDFDDTFFPPDGLVDQFDVTATSSYTGGTLEGLTPDFLFVQFQTLDSSAFSSLALPLIAELANFALDAQFTAARLEFGAGGTIDFDITSLSAEAVPLPAAAWLLLGGLVGLRTVGRRS